MTIGLTTTLSSWYETASAGAVSIQKVVRGRFGRKTAQKLAFEKTGGILSPTVNQKLLDVLRNPSFLETYERPPSGLGSTYILRDLSVVVKKSVSNIETRFNNMEHARALIETEKLALKVPKARIVEGYITEELLTIDTCYQNQIGIYVENRELFDIPVRDFVRFLFRTTLEDISGSQQEPFRHLCKAPLPRYDNIALSIHKGSLGHEKKGEIALIDLDYFTPSVNSSEENWSLNRLIYAIRLFPYHFNVIVCAGKEFDLTVDRFAINLLEERDRVLEYFKIVYEGPKTFMVKHAISICNPVKLVVLPPARIEEIRVIVASLLMEKKELRENLQNHLQTGFLTEKNFYCLIDRVQDYLMSKTKDKVAKKKKSGTFLDLGSILSCRFEHFMNIAWYGGVHPHVSNGLKNIGVEISYQDYTTLFGEILKHVFIEMEKGGEIAFFKYDLLSSHMENWIVFY